MKLFLHRISPYKPIRLPHVMLIILSAPGLLMKIEILGRSFDIFGTRKNNRY